MKRPITGFDVDEHGDPVALLSCGHRQHVRHAPPFDDRPWVTSEAGRRGMLGHDLDCPRCDRFELPEHFRLHRSTREFDEDTIPAGLCTDHTTAAGVWGRIVVSHGMLRYRVEGLPGAFVLTPATPGIVVPGQPHRVEAHGPVRFQVEFWRAP